jgi:hypothetical protein
VTTSEGAILTGAATTVMLAMTAIEAASHGRRRSSSLASLSLAVAMLVVGSMIKGFESPVLMVVTIAAVCAAQVAVAVFEPSARRASCAAWRPLEKRSAG